MQAAIWRVQDILAEAFRALAVFLGVAGGVITYAILRTKATGMRKSLHKVDQTDLANDVDDWKETGAAKDNDE